MTWHAQPPIPTTNAFRAKIQGTEVYGTAGKHIGEIDLIIDKMSGRGLRRYEFRRIHGLVLATIPSHGAP
jgi:hypothetical protein